MIVDIPTKNLEINLDNNLKEKYTSKNIGIANSDDLHKWKNLYKIVWERISKSEILNPISILQNII
ncbi:hypothetical protein U3516DRAFT_776450 [Neocallimastix sp. 'constans']